MVFVEVLLGSVNGLDAPLTLAPDTRQLAEPRLVEVGGVATPLPIPRSGSSTFGIDRTASGGSAFGDFSALDDMELDTDALVSPQLHRPPTTDHRPLTTDH